MEETDRLTNFMTDIRRLRAAGYEISDSDAYDWFMKNEAEVLRGQQALGLGQGILPKTSGERGPLPSLHSDERPGSDL